MAKIDDSKFTPKPPRIPTVGEKLGELDQWVNSENPQEGRWVDVDDDCDEDHASR